MGEEIKPFVFYTLAAIIIISAISVVRTRNIFHAAISLAVTFFGVSGLYLTLKADFLAGIQILIYVGAIIVLILFAIMLIAGLEKKEKLHFNFQLISLISVLASTFLICLILFSEFHNKAFNYIKGYSIKEIGEEIIRNQLVPFELISVLLLAAFIGASIIAKKEENQTENQSDMSNTKGGVL